MKTPDDECGCDDECGTQIYIMLIIGGHGSSSEYQRGSFIEKL